MWWKVLLFLWIAAFSALGIMTPVAGNLGAVTAIGKMSPGRMIPLKFSVTGAGTETGSAATIGSPALQPKAWAKAGICAMGPRTR